MTGITGQGTTFNLPNYTGELFQITPSDTPLLSVIGGLTGGREATSTEFEWEAFDLRNPGQNVALEGAAAPAGDGRVRFNITNVAEIHQETVEVSYTKQAAVGLKSGSNNDQPNPITDELDWQVQQKLKEIARDVEYSFINGAYVKPTDNTTARKTRGLLAAITTNVTAVAESAPLTQDILLSLMQDIYDSGGITEAETATLISNSYQKRWLTYLFITQMRYHEQTRNVGGVSLTTIDTDFGTVNLMLDRYMPTDTVVIASLEQLAPRFLNVPGKGFLFQEPLAKTGSSDKTQIYGEIGLEYGVEHCHGKITGLQTTGALPAPS